MSQSRNGMHRGDLHLFVDLGSAHIERPPEDIRKSQHVVDLVRRIGPSGSHDDILAGLHRLGVLDLRIRIGQSKDDRVGSHRQEHLRGQHPAFGQTDEDVRPSNGLGQGIAGRIAHERLLLGTQIFPTGIQYSLAVAHQDVFRAHPQRNVDPGARDRSRSCTVDHHLHLGDLLTHDLQRIEQRCPGNDRRTVLVVVHHRDVEFLDQTPFDLESLRCLDILQVDPPEGGRDVFHRLDKLLGIRGIDFDVEHIDVGKYLEQKPLALHHRFGSLGSDIAQSQHGRTVGDHGHQIALVGIFVRIFGLPLDLQTRLRPLPENTPAPDRAGCCGVWSVRPVFCPGVPNCGNAGLLPFSSYRFSSYRSS